jgi:hypothetical protein
LAPRPSRIRRKALHGALESTVTASLVTGRT